jgi:hypothetical protein
VEFGCPSPLVDDVLHPSLLETALLNLALNGRDAMLDGGMLKPALIGQSFRLATLATSTVASVTGGDRVSYRAACLFVGSVPGSDRPIGLQNLFLSLRS